MSVNEHDYTQPRRTSEPVPPPQNEYRQPETIRTVPARPEIVSRLNSGDITPTSASIWSQGSPGRGSRFWALPDKNLKWWILREDESGRADSLIEGQPSILSPEMTPEEKSAAGERCRELVSKRLREQYQEDGYNLVKRMMLGGVMILAAIIGLRFLEYVDVPLLIAALGYTGYATIRYGMRVLKSMEAANRPFSQFTGEPFVVNGLADRIARALEFRRTVAPEKRGESPDDELLDANAYRKLIRDGVTSREELAALGRAVEQRLEVKTDGPQAIGDVARAEGLDRESAAFYRDLTQAANEISMDVDLR